MYKIEYTSKILCLSFLFIYFFVQHNVWFYKLSDPLLKASLTKLLPSRDQKIDIVITGGSNALVGVSSQQISTSTALNSFNLAISAAEGAGIMSYEQWLADSGVTADTVVYSSMNFWFMSKLSTFEGRPNENYQLSQNRSLIEVPISRVLAKLLQKKSTFATNQYGDIDPPSCDIEIPPMPNFLTDIASIDSTHISRFINTAYKLKQVLHAEHLVIRVPPIYVSSSDTAIFTRYMTHVSDLLTINGVKIIGLNQALTSDPTKMCFGPNHPTISARREYTDALTNELFNRKMAALP